MKLSEFNDKAMTVDGKPLALGNGKIISNPLLQVRTISIRQVNVRGMSSINVHKLATMITFWGDARNWAGQASVTALKSITNLKRCDSTDW